MSVPPLAVSVVVPVFNGARFLPEAVACIRAQTLKPSEVIVVDDGSSDATPEVARTLGPGIIYLRQENLGCAAARNRGLGEARSDAVAILDVDDLWPADNLEILARCIGSDADLAIGYTRLVTLSGAQPTGFRFGPDASPDRFFALLTGAALFRRTAFEKVGRFNESVTYVDDLDWFLRARESSVVRMAVSEHVSLVKREHDANMTRHKSVASMGLASALRESLERRRRSDGHAGQLREWMASVPKEVQ
jgi:glycosyltransferase involved in cell wall biosynthesis